MKTSRIPVYLLVWLAMLAAEIYSAFRLWKLSMLPLRYKLLITILFTMVWLLAGLLYMLGNNATRGKHPGLWRRIIAWVLAIVMIAGSLYSVRFANQLDETIDKVTTTVAVTSTIGVYVLKDDPAEYIEDAEGYTFGITKSYDSSNTNTAVKQLKEKLDEMETETHDTVADMVDALYAKKNNAIILNEAYASLLEDQDDYETFSEDTRILYEIVVEEGDSDQIISNAISEDANVEVGDYNSNIDILKPVNVTEEPFVVYLSGSDTRSKMLSTSRSDVNILMVVNPVSKQILMVNTPRDYYVPNPAGKGALDKLTHCGIYGIGCSVSALANLYSTPVNYYAQINFTGFETLIDAIGGVTVDSDYAFKTFSVGENHLNGKEALVFARDRHSFATGDNQRGKNQMKILSAVIDKLSTGTIIMHHAQILNSLQGMFVTNLSSDEINNLVKMQLNDGAKWNIKSFAVTGNGGSNYTYSMPNFRAYVMYQDAGLVNAASELVRRVINGDNLTKQDVSKSA